MKKRVEPITAAIARFQATVQAREAAADLAEERLGAAIADTTATTDQISAAPSQLRQTAEAEARTTATADSAINRIRWQRRAAVGRRVIVWGRVQVRNAWSTFVGRWFRRNR